MKRRTLLKWASSALAVISASLVAVPGVGYLAERLRRRSANELSWQRIARLRDLPAGRPVLMPVIGSRRDAWTAYPAETIGRVWLVHQAPANATETTHEVQAFTAVCPHLGCQIQLDSTQDRFVCPCHRAVFSTNGAPTPEQEAGNRNHAPRGMDSLDCQIVKDEQTNESWVEVKYQKFELGLTRKVAQI